MQLLLKVISGAQIESTISLRDGQLMQIGRTEWADRSFPDDLLMSSIHFSVECGSAGCIVKDLKSTNGTYVNGKKQRDAVLIDGDEIRAGNTVFSVKIEGSIPITSSQGAVEVNRHTLATMPDFNAEALRAQLLSGEPAPVDKPDQPSKAPTPQSSGQASGPATQLVLESLTGSRVQKILLRANETATIGRTERADLAIADDLQLSSIHFSIDWQVGNFRIRDLGSTNGTMVNDHLIAEAILQDGDRIRAGRTHFTVHIERENTPADASRQTVATLTPPAIDDDDVEVRRLALWSAAWARQGWVLDHCRRLCDNPKPQDSDSIYLLGVLGRTVDLRSIKSIGNNAMLGPERFRTLGAYGHPDTVELILKVIAGENANDAASAGAAFERITGVILEWNVSAPAAQDQTAEANDDPPPEETLVPDVQQAIDAWESLKARFGSCTRICRGFDLSRGCDQNVLAQLDMQSRYETLLRARIAGAWSGHVAELERFPLGT